MRPECKHTMGLANGGVMPDMSRNAGEWAIRARTENDYVYLIIEEQVVFGELLASTSASATFGKGWPTS